MGVTGMYPPLKSKIEVYEVGSADRTYEAVTDERQGLWGRPVKQLSGAKLDITVSESRSRFWGGGNPTPSTFSRKHSVYYQPDGRQHPVPMHEVRLPAEVDLFKASGKPGELVYFIPWTGSCTDEPGE